MGKIFDQIIGILIKMATMLYGMGAMIVTLFTSISEKVVSVTAFVFDEMAEMTTPAGYEAISFSDVAGYLSFANSMIPVQEAWALLIFMVPYMTVIVLYRFVKSWIPTMAN